MGLTAGFATPEGTERFVERAVGFHHLPQEHFRAFQGLKLTSLGMGTYLGRSDDATDRLVTEAVELSISSHAINVVDTAINYRQCHGERSVGQALSHMLTGGKVRRDELFIATKNGYVSDENRLSELVRKGVLRSDEVASGSNCMSPAFLREELSKSRENLGLETIDLLYLHNVTDEHISRLGQRRFLEELGRAFGFLEDSRRNGWIRFYGLATWDSLRVPMSSHAYLGLREAVSAAEEVGGKEHGFRFIQFPFNLAMPEAAVRRNQNTGGRAGNLFEAAHSLGIGTFSSVPLLQGKLPAEEALQFARSAPNHLAPLVGHKEREHVDANLAVARLTPLGRTEFEERLKDLAI